MCFRGGGSAEYGQRPYFYNNFFLDPSLSFEAFNDGMYSTNMVSFD